MDYIPPDAQNVNIRVSVLADGETCSVNGVGTVISQFQLSNQGTADQMSGSLDNLLPAKYCIVATLTRDGVGFVNGTCGNDSEGDLIIFQASADVTIVSSETKEVRLVMVSCAETYIIDGFAVPEFPATVVTVSVDYFSKEGQPSGSVLGANEQAKVVFSVQNHNYKIPAAAYTDNKVVVNIDNHGSFDPTNNPAHTWSLTTQETSVDSSSPSTSDADDNDVTLTSIQQLASDHSDGISHHTLTLTVDQNATKASTAEATINTFAYNSDTQEDMGGTSDSIDFVVNPVGDLDIQIATLSAVRPKVNEVFGHVATKPVGHYSQETVTKSDDSQCKYAEEIKKATCAISGTTCGVNGYVMPSDGKSRFVLYNQYIPSTVKRTIKLSHTPVNSEASNCSKFTFTLSQESSSNVIEASSPGFSNNNQAYDYNVYLDVVGNGELDDVPGLCKVTVSIETEFEGHSTHSRTYAREIVFGYMGANGCDAYDPDDGVNIGLARKNFCPALSVIEWGSIDNWINAPICDDNNTGTQAPIMFCAFTSPSESNLSYPMYDHTDFDVKFYYTKDDSTYHDISFSEYTVNSTNQKDFSINQVNELDGPCKQFLLDSEAVQGTSQVLEVTITFTGKPPMCDFTPENNMVMNAFGAVITATNKGSESGLCSSIKNEADFSDVDKKDSTLMCRYGMSFGAGDSDDSQCLANPNPDQGGSGDARRSILSVSRRSIESVSGCPEDSIYRCPAENNMPFQIKVEDGRLTVSMDPARLEGQTIQVETDPTGMLPTRSRFIAADFSKYMLPTSPWSDVLKLKMDQLLNNAYLKQNLKPGVTADELVACCGLVIGESQSIIAAMDSILATEQLQAFKPRISIAKDPESNEDETTSAQTTSTTTSTSTTSEKSDSSLLVVVAVAGILVLVAVIALAIFTVKNNKQSQRVVDMRGVQQSSWQKGGAMESDF